MSNGSFSGWGPGLVEFFQGLSQHNNAEWLHRHRTQFQNDVRRPTEALVADLEPQYGQAKIFRLNRDARFAPEGSRYRTNIAAQFDCSGAHYYVSVSADELIASVGWFRPDRTWLQQFRRSVAGPSGESLAEIVRALDGQGFEIGGAALKTVPKGYPADHPRAELLRYRGITASRRWAPSRWLDEPSARDLVVHTWEQARDLAQWLRAHVRIGDG